jgi:hypothetical protein
LQLNVGHSLVDVEFSRHPLSAISLSFLKQPAELSGSLRLVQLVYFF